MRTVEAEEAFRIVASHRWEVFRGEYVWGRALRDMWAHRFAHRQAHVAFEYRVKVRAIVRLLQAGVAGNPGMTRITWGEHV